jgi:hypothetical protein
MNLEPAVITVPAILTDSVVKVREKNSKKAVNMNRKEYEHQKKKP